MTLACEISDEIVPRVLNECLCEYIRLICPYLEDSINRMRDKESDQAENIAGCTKIMIAVANNLYKCAETTEKLKRFIEGLRNKTSAEDKIENEKCVSTESLSSKNKLGSLQQHKHLDRKMQNIVQNLKSQKFISDYKYFHHYFH
ncbi:unnamed protein product [Thelazia callipaeda]|uniref:MIF4G domain-containing protein n=1 Tax=Thelazia callipaeda TaxID=103827 RepID=A0A0N5CNB5_THECL|nr:unnamed protein product [Thelazia callipaeda]